MGQGLGGVPRTNLGSSRGGGLALTLKDGPRADGQLPPLPGATTGAALPRGRLSVVTTWGELLASGGWRPGTLPNTPLAGDTVAGHSEGTAPQRIISFMSFLWLPQQRTTNRGLKSTEFIPLVWRPESQMTVLGRGPGGGSFLPLPGGSEAQDLSTSLGGHGSCQPPNVSSAEVGKPCTAWRSPSPARSSRPAHAPASQAPRAHHRPARLAPSGLHRSSDPPRRTCRPLML